MVRKAVLPQFLVPTPCFALRSPAIHNPALGGIEEFVSLEVRKICNRSTVPVRQCIHAVKVEPAFHAFTIPVTFETDVVFSPFFAANGACVRLLQCASLSYIECHGSPLDKHTKR